MLFRHKAILFRVLFVEGQYNKPLVEARSFVNHFWHDFRARRESHC